MDFAGRLPSCPAYNALIHLDINALYGIMIQYNGIFITKIRDIYPLCLVFQRLLLAKFYCMRLNREIFKVSWVEFIFIFAIAALIIFLIYTI